MIADLREARTAHENMSNRVAKLLRLWADDFGVVDGGGLRILAGVDIKIHSSDDVSVVAFSVCEKALFRSTDELFLFDLPVRVAKPCCFHTHILSRTQAIMRGL